MNSKFLNTQDRFKTNQTVNPYSSEDVDPLPTRNIYSLFGDGGHDLFRHGLADITILPEDANSSDGNRLSQFKETSDYFIQNDGFGSVTAKEDPVMFGFDLIIRAQESPLFSSTLPDSVESFFRSDTVNGNKEMLSREKTWMTFKTQFFQFFRDNLNNMAYSESANKDNPSNSRFYYYLKKVTGLENLVESNSSDTIKSFIDYGKDTIKLEFTEDVSLRLGRLAQLYKTLYWSRLSGKTMIPENLLRFDCDIVISEVRNFVKVKKVLDDKNVNTNDLKVLKDNVNRYVYTLYDCQLFFDKMTHPGEIDLGSAPTESAPYAISFNYKFSTLRVDAFDVRGDKSYTSVNNGSYDPYSITPLDRFLTTESKVDTSISETMVRDIPEVSIEIINFEGNIISPNKPNSNSDITNAKSKSKIGPDISDKKANLLDKSKDIADVKSDNKVSKTKSDMNKKQVDDAKDGKAKNSWLKSDTAGARFAKRIANAGISVVNSSILSRAAILNKTLDKITGNLPVGPHSITPPLNIYTDTFNGQVASSSKQVRDAFTKFTGESIADLFKKK